MWKISWGLLAASLLLLAGYLSAIGAQQWPEPQAEDETTEQAMEQEPVEGTRAMSLEAIKEQVIGLTEIQIKARLGEPESTRQLSSQDGPVELYSYQGKEGRVNVKLVKGVAIGASVD